METGLHTGRDSRMKCSWHSTVLGFYSSELAYVCLAVHCGLAQLSCELDEQYCEVIGLVLMMRTRRRMTAFSSSSSSLLWSTADVVSQSVICSSFSLLRCCKLSNTRACLHRSAVEVCEVTTQIRKYPNTHIELVHSELSNL